MGIWTQKAFFLKVADKCNVQSLRFLNYNRVQGNCFEINSYILNYHKKCQQSKIKIYNAVLFIYILIS